MPWIFWLLTGCETSAIYVATVEVSDDGPAVAMAAGGPLLAAHTAAISKIFPDDAPYRDLQPVHMAVRGWGDSEAEAVRNASARLGQIMALRRQSRLREVMWLFAEQKRHADPSFALTDDTTYYSPGGAPEGWGPRQPELAGEISRELYGLATHLDTVRVSHTETIPRGAVTTSYEREERCSPRQELTQIPTSGAGYDLLASFVCEQVYVTDLVMGQEAAAHAGPIRQQLFGKIVRLADECYTLCLETVNLTPGGSP